MSSRPKKLPHQITFPLDQDPLQSRMRTMIEIVATGGTLTFVTVLPIVMYLTYLGIKAFRSRTTVPPHFYNLFLVYNLLIGNCMSSFAFAMNWRYVTENALRLGDFCTTQGMFLQVGDMVGSAFTTSIAFQIFCALVLRRTSGKAIFYSSVVYIWLFSILLGPPMPALDRAITGKHEIYYSMAGAWCWISPIKNAERLWTHYLFIFIDQILCIVLYTCCYIKLRLLRRQAIKSMGRHYNTDKLESSSRKMILYPMAYTISTLPLATARVANMAGRKIPHPVVCAVGTMLSLQGIFNAIVYGMTRHVPSRNSYNRRQGTAGDIMSSPAPNRLSCIPGVVGTIKRAAKHVHPHRPQSRERINSSDRLNPREIYELPLVEASPTSTHITTNSINKGSIFVKSETTIVSEAASPSQIHPNPALVFRH